MDPLNPHSEMTEPKLINDSEYGSDLAGTWVLRAGHVRKAYPRDEQTLLPNGEVDVNVPHFVTTSGGEYFFQPSIAALKMMATA